MKVLALTLALLGPLALASSAAAVHDVDNNRMIGGGWIDDPNILVGKVTLGFELPCALDNPDIRPSLQVNWRQNSFTLRGPTSLTLCAGKGELGAVAGETTGICNGQPATARFSFTNTAKISPDRAYYRNAVERLEITGSEPGCTLTLANTGLTGGTFRFMDNPEL
jgi:hypothetical protein